ncbi:MAG: DUF4129 domain-containing protein, partial [Planctomycetaceae bacterium]|nr:DUF4129 domain-containing protein [Planctomycetaceae bacterium]
AREESVQQLESSNESMIGRIRSAWEHTWTQGVRLSRADQDRMLYTPIRDSAVELWNAVRDLPSAGTRLGDLLRALGTSPERWISWRGGVVVFVLLSLSSAVFLLVRRLWRLLRGLRGAATELLRPAPVVPFYERFRAIAARAGYERAGPQTPREFARNISQRMGDGTAPRPVEIPQLVTESYYRVRFGEEQLPADLVQKLQSQLDELERQLSLPHAAAAAR